MSQVIIPKKTETGWIMEIPPEMAALLKVESGSIAILYPTEGELKTEILPAPTIEMKTEFERLFDKYQDTFAELKRPGD
jgi:hypothetical protein